MPSPTVTIEAEFTPATWTDISADVLRPISIRRGIDGAGPLDLVASTGQMQFSLINSSLNSGGLLGYYSPDHANARNGFALGLHMRLKLDDGVNPAQYKFYGKVVEISPTFGQMGERVTAVTVVDIMDELATQKLDKLAVQENKRNDQIANTLLGALPVAPLATSLGTGPDTFAYALHNNQDERTVILGAIAKAMQSGLDYFYVKGDATGGETIAYQSRHDRIKNTSVDATFSDTMRGLSVIYSNDNIFNRIVVVSYPSKVDTAATTILASQVNEIIVQPGETFVIDVRYRDPNNQNQRISGIEIVDPLVADTHFRMSSVSEDGGNDLNGDADITLSVGANACEVSIENTGSVAGHINKLEIVGKGIYHYDPAEYIAEDDSSILGKGERPLILNLFNNDNPNTGKDFGDHLLEAYKDQSGVIEALQIMGNSSAALLDAAVSLEPGNRIAMNETATGLDSEYFIQGYDMTIMPNDLLDVTYVVKSAVVGVFWFMGEVGSSELDDVTKLGF